jgi:hypothetical protein
LVTIQREELFSWEITFESGKDLEVIGHMQGVPGSDAQRDAEELGARWG